MNNIKGVSRGVTIAVVAMAASLGVAACGSSSSSGSSGSNASAGTGSSAANPAGATGARGTALVACLKKHGVSLPSRAGFTPGAGGLPGGGTGTTGNAGALPSGRRPKGFGFLAGGRGRLFNAKTQAAFKACGANFGAGGAGGRFSGGFQPRFAAKTINSFVACVKQHGYTLPKPNTSGTGAIFPTKIETNPKFVAASKSCSSILRSGFRGPGGAGVPGGAGGPAGA